jgi:hypothetical protein
MAGGFLRVQESKNKYYAFFVSLKIPFLSLISNSFNPDPQAVLSLDRDTDKN